MFKRKCLAVFTMILGAVFLVCSGVSWWLCQDGLCAVFAIGCFIAELFGSTVWDEAKEN